MAPILAQSTLDLIHDMLVSGELTTSQMVKTANCSKRAIFRLCSNLRLFGTLKAPLIKGGRPRKLTPPMLEVLCDHLIEKPGLYLHKIELFLLDEFDIRVPKSTISDTLRQSGWSRKECRQQARERNTDLRNDYIHLISEFQSFHLVYVDESGCDKRIGFRRSG